MRSIQHNRSGADPLILRQRGIGILEVLVALVVVSFGVLGMAGLQLTGMKLSNNGFNRVKAVMLSENMATRMRINRTGVQDGLYNGFDSITVSCATLPDPYCQASEDIDAQRCNASQLATFDMFSVACGDRGAAGDTGSPNTSGGIADLLPADSKLVVTCNDAPCTAESSYTISMQWPEGTNASGNSQKTSRVQMRLRP